MAFALTLLQSTTLGFIRSHLAEQGVAPTLQEIAAHLGHNSKGSAHRVLRALEERGHIRRLPRRNRAIELTEKPAVPKTAEAPRVRIVVDAMNRVKHYECEGAVNVTIVKEREVPGERG